MAPGTAPDKNTATAPGSKNNDAAAGKAVKTKPDAKDVKACALRLCRAVKAHRSAEAELADAQREADGCAIAELPIIIEVDGEQYIIDRNRRRKLEARKVGGTL